MLRICAKCVLLVIVLDMVGIPYDRINCCPMRIYIKYGVGFVEDFD